MKPELVNCLMNLIGKVFSWFFSDFVGIIKKVDSKNRKLKRGIWGYL
jgi:hypothetical protein